MSADSRASNEPRPVTTTAIATTAFDTGSGPTQPNGRTIPWPEARDLLAAERFYWLATVHPDGAPHVRPVLGVWDNGALFSTTNPTARKARNLQLDARVAVTARTASVDLVVEGSATPVTDDATLRRVAAAYRAKYGWPVTIRDGAFDAPYGAPTSGPPPYAVYAIHPSVVFGFGTGDTFGPRSTRWRF